MFQSALVRPHGEENGVADAGKFAETLLFYNKVHVAADRSFLTGLLQVVGPQDFLQLLKDGRISLSYSKHHSGVAASGQSYMPIFNFVSMALERTQNGKKRVSKNDEIRMAVGTAMGFGGKSKKITDGIIERTQFVDRAFSIGETLSIAHGELDDARVLIEAVISVLRIMVPTYVIPNNLHFSPIYFKEDFTISTNIDFVAVNKEYHKFFIPEQDTITISTILNWILTARLDANMAAEYLAEIVTKDVSSALIRLKIMNIIQRRDKSIKQIDVFQETTLDQCKMVREAINSGERSFADFLRVLEKADKFKRWLSNQNPDANLVTEYYRSVMAEGPMSSLPAKTLRYVTASLAGVINLGAGLIVAGADEFLADKLLRGWRPNHFVDGPLKKLVNIE